MADESALTQDSGGGFSLGDLGDLFEEGKEVADEFGDDVRNVGESLGAWFGGDDSSGSSGSTGDASVRPPDLGLGPGVGAGITGGDDDDDDEGDDEGGLWASIKRAWTTEIVGDVSVGEATTGSLIGLATAAAVRAGFKAVTGK